MEEKKNPSESAPALALVLTREQAAALLAATTHYVAWVRQHPDLAEQEMVSVVEDLSRELAEQARAPMLHPNCVQGIEHLMTLNRHIQLKEEYSEEHIWASTWLRSHNIPVYVDTKAGIYRYGTTLGAAEVSE